MSTIAVIGGSGTVGRHIVDALQAQGAETRILGRSSTAHPVDLTTGTGLEAALGGCDVVVDASNGPPRKPEPVLVDGARRLVDACAATGVGHLVLVSIVGIEQVPTRYYRAKLAQERVVAGAGLSWSIVRSTQFHELVDTLLRALADWRLQPRSRARLQPVAAREAGAAVAAAALEPRPGATRTIAGPQIEDITELSRDWSAARRRRGVPLPLPLPRRFAVPMRAGALTCERPDERGTVRFSSWLATPS
jgi:uncharacterized protein YbjT (DUF2867 family)